MQWTFLQLESTYGMPETAVYSDFEYFYVDFYEDFGIAELSSASVAEFN